MISSVKEKLLKLPEHELIEKIVKASERIKDDEKNGIVSTTG